MRQAGRAAGRRPRWRYILEEVARVTRAAADPKRLRMKRRGSIREGGNGERTAEAQRQKEGETDREKEKMRERKRHRNKRRAKQTGKNKGKRKAETQRQKEAETDREKGEKICVHKREDRQNRQPKRDCK